MRISTSTSTCTGAKNKETKNKNCIHYKFSYFIIIIISFIFILAVSFYVNTSVSTTSVPEDQNAMICVQRNGTTQRNYTVTIQPSVIPGGAQCKRIFYHISIMGQFLYSKCVMCNMLEMYFVWWEIFYFAYSSMKGIMFCI